MDTVWELNFKRRVLVAELSLQVTMMIKDKLVGHKTGKDINDVTTAGD